MIALSETYPNAVKIIEHKIDNRKHLELVLSNNLDVAQACQDGFEFQSKRVIGMQAMSHEAKIIKLNLFNLPCFDMDELLVVLQTNLSRFGNVLDAGIYQEPKYKTYMGTGFAVLDLQQNDSSRLQPFSPLTRTITFPPDPHLISVTWNTISEDCIYCHKASHTRINCPIQQQKSLFCWNCMKRGHLPKDCCVKPAEDAESMKHDARMKANTTTNRGGFLYL
ncbi:hypothetical protein J3Q64DRAFT_1734307 [Phycomyces blakesleeanus]